MVLWRYMEPYPTIRWNFDCERYVLIGAPQGITDRFVYLFKASKSRDFFLVHEWPVTMVELDLYGLFLERREKRVQVLFVDESSIGTWQTETDGWMALETLRKFRRVEKGEEEPLPPGKLKCELCPLEFFLQCRFQKGQP
mgnify:CR=1 FL=1